LSQASFNASVFQNFPSKSADHAMTAMRDFQDAMGIYRRRIFESFNPLYWINLVLFLPKNILGYVGFKTETALIKIFQLIWWLAGIVFAIFKDDIFKYLKSVITIKFF
jgi:hypothetical protein